MNNPNFITHINSHSLTGISAGASRNDFLQIWMVVARERVFARSWGLSERSWYNTFLTESYGEILCGDLCFRVRGFVPADILSFTEEINQAYLDKYMTTEHKKPYALQIVKEPHLSKTMEFKLIIGSK